mmetsp:Transcript_22367/g.39601  ORF Transcript_22367/g.39601 Transcript_22367/m.39601 type:complete len:301 (+) Transcript_22367:51-953(+)
MVAQGARVAGIGTAGGRGDATIRLLLCLLCSLSSTSATAMVTGTKHRALQPPARDFTIDRDYSKGPEITLASRKLPQLTTPLKDRMHTSHADQNARKTRPSRNKTSYSGPNNPSRARLTHPGDNTLASKLNSSPASIHVAAANLTAATGGLDMTTVTNKKAAGNDVSSVIQAAAATNISRFRSVAEGGSKASSASGEKIKPDSWGSWFSWTYKDVKQPPAWLDATKINMKELGAPTTKPPPVPQMIAPPLPWPMEGYGQNAANMGMFGGMSPRRDYSGTSKRWIPWGAYYSSNPDSVVPS